MVQTVEDKMKYEEITKRIIGCAMRVHSILGNGFQEVQPVKYYV